MVILLTPWMPPGRGSALAILDNFCSSSGLGQGDGTNVTRLRPEQKGTHRWFIRCRNVAK